MDSLDGAISLKQKIQPVRNFRNSASVNERPKANKEKAAKPLHEQFTGKFLDPDSFKFK